MCTRPIADTVEPVALRAACDQKLGPDNPRRQEDGRSEETRVGRRVDIVAPDGPAEELPPLTMLGQCVCCLVWTLMMMAVAYPSVGTRISGHMSYLCRIPDKCVEISYQLLLEILERLRNLEEVNK
jgi:hypothetical protein